MLPYLKNFHLWHFSKILSSLYFPMKFSLAPKSAKSTVILSMLLGNNWVILKKKNKIKKILRTFEPLAIAKNPQTNEPTNNQPVKQTLGVFERFLVKECLDNLTTVNERQAKTWMLMHVTCIESCMETKIYGRW